MELEESRGTMPTQLENKVGKFPKLCRGTMPPHSWKTKWENSRNYVHETGGEQRHNAHKVGKYPKLYTGYWKRAVTEKVAA